MKAKQLKQLLARLSDETEVTGIVLEFVDDPAAPSATTSEELSFAKEGYVLNEVTIQAESSASLSAIKCSCGCCPPPRPPRPYFHY